MREPNVVLIKARDVTSGMEAVERDGTLRAIVKRETTEHGRVRLTLAPVGPGSVEAVLTLGPARNVRIYRRL